MSEEQMKRTILIASSSPDNKVMLRRIFSAEFNIQEAKDGFEAQEYHQLLKDVAVVIMDILAPMPGYKEFLSFMGKDEGEKHIPFVVLADGYDEEGQLTAIDNGASEVFTKPFNSKIILHRVKNIITRYEISFRYMYNDGRSKWVRLSRRATSHSENKAYANDAFMYMNDKVSGRTAYAIKKSKLKHQHMPLKWLYDTIPCGIMQFEAKCGRYGYRELIGLNDVSWKILGYASRQQYIEDVKGRSKIRNIHQDDALYVQECIEKVCFADDNKPLECECRIVCPDGGIRWIRCVFQKVGYAINEGVLQVVFSDITEQKHEDLKRLSDALFSAYDEVYEFDINENLIVLRASHDNSSAELGKTMSFSGSVDSWCRNAVNPEDRDKFKMHYSSIVWCTEDMPITLEYRCKKLDGKEHWVASTVIHVDGPIYLVCNRDVTDKKKTEQLLLENRTLQMLVNQRHIEDERNRIFIDSTGILVYDYDPYEDKLMVRRKTTGGSVVMEETEKYLKNFSDNTAISIADRKRIQDCFEEAVKEPIRRTLEYRSNRFGNGFCLCRIQIASIADSENRVYRVIGQLAKVGNEQQERLLSEKLHKITGFYYNDVPYQHDITEDVLKILANTSDSDIAMQTVLEVVGKQLNVSRVYIVEEHGDGVHCSNTFEWCNNGVVPEINNLQNYTYPDGMRDMYIKMFKDDGVLSCSDIDTLPEWLKDTLAPQGIKAVVQCAIMKNGDFMGFVGFDECRRKRAWSEIQIYTLKIISQVIGSFLFANRGKQNKEPSEEVIKAMEESPAYMYVIDPDTYEIIYSNSAVRAVEKVGIAESICYKTFTNSSTECVACPVKKLKKTGITVPVRVMENDGQYIMQASWITWYGRKAVLISGTDCHSFSENTDDIHKA